VADTIGHLKGQILIPFYATDRNR